MVREARDANLRTITTIRGAIEAYEGRLIDLDETEARSDLRRRLEEAVVEAGRREAALRRLEEVRLRHAGYC